FPRHQRSCFIHRLLRAVCLVVFHFRSAEQGSGAGGGVLGCCQRVFGDVWRGLIEPTGAAFAVEEAVVFWFKRREGVGRLRLVLIERGDHVIFDVAGGFLGEACQFVCLVVFPRDGVGHDVGIGEQGTRDGV